MPLELLKIKADKSQLYATSCTHTDFLFSFSKVSFCSLLSTRYSHSTSSFLFLFLFPFPSPLFPFFSYLFIYCFSFSFAAFPCHPTSHTAVWHSNCKPLSQKVQNCAEWCSASTGLELQCFVFFFSTNAGQLL